MPNECQMEMCKASKRMSKRRDTRRELSERTKCRAAGTGEQWMECSPSGSPGGPVWCSSVWPSRERAEWFPGPKPSTTRPCTRAWLFGGRLVGACCGCCGRERGSEWAVSFFRAGMPACWQRATAAHTHPLRRFRPSLRTDLMWPPRTVSTT